MRVAKLCLCSAYYGVATVAHAVAPLDAWTIAGAYDSMGRPTIEAGKQAHATPKDYVSGLHAWTAGVSLGDQPTINTTYLMGFASFVGMSQLTGGTMSLSRTGLETAGVEYRIEIDNVLCFLNPGFDFAKRETYFALGLGGVLPH